MIERLTICKLSTCDCEFTIKYTYQDENDISPTASLYSYGVKCGIHSELNDNNAYAAAVHLARVINIGENYSEIME